MHPLLTLFFFTVFESGGVSDPADLAPIRLKVTTEQVGRMAAVTIMNATVNDDLDFDPVVTKVVFGGYNESLTLEAIEAIEASGVSFQRDDDVNIPAINSLDFQSSIGFKATPPPTANGINSGELLSIMMETPDDIDALIGSGDIVVALHVQSINGGSAAYKTNPFPEPSVIMLLSVAGFLLLLKRR